MRKKLMTLLSAALLVAAAPLLAACTSGSASDPSDEHNSASASHDSAELILQDGWAKSATANGMTGVFGMLHNNGDEDIVLSRVESDAAGMVELHEVTAAGVMQEIAGDVVVESGGSFELVPGGNHIMLMALHHDLLAGDEVSFTIFYTVGDEEHSLPFTVLVKDYAGANEDYGGGHGEHADDAHANHAHGDGEHDEHASH